jgi:hypothetical protein
MRKVFRITLGVVLVLIGLIGGLIPIFQGWMFGIPGLIILSEYFPPVKRLVDWGQAKWDAQKEKMKAAKMKPPV